MHTVRFSTGHGRKAVIRKSWIPQEVTLSFFSFFFLYIASSFNGIAHGPRTLHCSLFSHFVIRRHLPVFIYIYIYIYIHEQIQCRNQDGKTSPSAAIERVVTYTCYRIDELDHQESVCPHRVEPGRAGPGQGTGRNVAHQGRGLSIRHRVR